jgi:hypothetical protein
MMSVVVVDNEELHKLWVLLYDVVENGEWSIVILGISGFR